jgi:hypothetical protein
MQVKLTIRHTTPVDHSWMKEVESLGRSDRSAVNQAHVVREETFWFNAKDRTEAEAIEKRINQWKARLPIDHLVSEGFVEYFVESASW